MSVFLRSVVLFFVSFCIALIESGCITSRDVDCVYADIVHGLPTRCVILERVGAQCSENAIRIVQFHVLYTFSQSLKIGDSLFFCNHIESSETGSPMSCAPKNDLYYYDWVESDKSPKDCAMIYGDMPVPLWLLWNSLNEDVKNDMLDEDLFIHHYKLRALKIDDTK